MTLSVNYAILTKQIYLHLLGEWLNGRVAVSKTVGCVFESRLPCQCPVILKMTGHLRNYWIQPSHRNCFRTFFHLYRSFFPAPLLQTPFPRCTNSTEHPDLFPVPVACLVFLTGYTCLLFPFKRLFLSAFSFFTGYFCTRENPG